MYKTAPRLPLLARTRQSKSAATRFVPEIAANDALATVGRRTVTTGGDARPPPRRRAAGRRLCTGSDMRYIECGVVAGIILLSAACRSPSPAPASSAPAAAGEMPAAIDRDGGPQAGPGAGALAPLLDQPFAGDFDQLVQRRLIRAGVVFNRTQYFIDRGVQRGIVFEALQLFEQEINARLRTGSLPVHVAFVPLARDQLLPALVAGKVDLVAAALTVTPERERLVAFSNPTRMGVSEIVVSAAGPAGMSGLDDLSGRTVSVRRSSSYYDSLMRLNAELKRRGKPAVVVNLVPETLEDDDLLEMVNAGLLPATVVDDFIARFWQPVLTQIRLNPSAAVKTGGALAVAVRKDNPALLGVINEWIAKYGPTTAFGNVIDRRYLQDTAYVTQATDQDERDKFVHLVGLFRTYATRYRLDPLMLAAQGYEESRLDQDGHHHLGALGVMQVMPATANELAVGDVRQIEPNIHAGAKIIRALMDQHYADEPMDPMNRMLMTLAAYNAGPGRIHQLREEARERGLNPNVWFGNVERIASERVGRDTVQYVSNIYKYYVAYRLISLSPSGAAAGGR
jgi:membrane-bound lytic murein transglycosylase MltF